jgi:hypothetical protein
MWKKLKRIVLVTLTIFTGLFVIALILIHSYKKEIKEVLLNEANKRVSGKVGFQDIDFTFFNTFPHISVTILKPFFQDSLSKTYIFSAEKIYFHAHLTDIFSHNIHVTSLYCNNASFSAITDKSGRSNLEAIKSIEHQLKEVKKSESTTDVVNKKSPDILLKEIVFKQVKVEVIDSSRHKDISFLFENVTTSFERLADTLDIKLRGQVFFKGLAFNTEKGGFLEKKHTTLNVHAGLYIPKRRIHIYPSDLYTEKQHIVMEGLFNLAQKPGEFELAFRNDKTDLASCKSLLNAHLQNKLKRYNAIEPLMVDAKISGSLGRGNEPAVIVRFAGKNITASMDTLVVKNATLQGEFTNQYSKEKLAEDKNSILKLNVSSGVLADNPIHLKLTIQDLSNPNFDISSALRFQFNEKSKGILKRFLVSNPELLTNLLKLRTDKPILANLQLHGRLTDSNVVPMGSLEALITDTELVFEKYRSSHTSARVFITNHSDEKLLPSLKNTKVDISYFQAQVQGAQVMAHLIVTDFITPHLEVSTIVKTALTNLIPFLPKGMPLTLQSGEAKLKIDYSGKIINPEQKNFTTLPGTLSGTINLEKASFSYQPQQLTASAVNALILLNNNDLMIKNFSGIVTGHRFEIAGSLKDIVPYLFAPTDNDPFLDIKATMGITLKELNARLKTEKYRFEKGNLDILIAYQGFIKDYLNNKTDKVRSVISGSLTVKDAYFHYLPDDFQYSEFNGTLTFNENDVQIHNLNGFFNENPLQISGKARQIIPFFTQDDKQISADLQIHSPDLNLNKILKIKNRKKLSQQILPVIKNPNYKEDDVFDRLNQALPARRTMSQVFDQITDKIQTNISLTADKAYYRNVIATQVRGELHLKPKMVEIVNTGLYTAGGLLTLNGNIDLSSSGFDKMKFQVGVQRVDVQELFAEFENFNQHTVVDKNLRGTLNAKIDFDADLLPSLKIVSESMKGTMNIKLSNGQLLDFAPLGDVQKVIFKKRDFKNIRFAVIENDFILSGTEIGIKRMEIESSIMDLYIEGRYSFAENTDMSIQIPLKHIFRRKKNFNPAIPDTTTFTGASVYLKAVSKNGKIHISYDPFKRIRDKKEKKRQEKVQSDSAITRKDIDVLPGTTKVP